MLRSRRRRRAAGARPAGRGDAAPAGGTRSACSTSRYAHRGASVRSARCTSTTACGRRRAGTRRSARRCASRLGVELSVVRPRRPAGAGNVQAWARDAALRRRRWRWPRGADVAAGHTATDQVETILYRLASSPSRRALLGMRPREGCLIRPLLGFTREETAAYCRERRLSWREDEHQRRSAVRPRADAEGGRAGAALGAPGRRGQRARARRCAPGRGRGARRRSSTTCSAGPTRCPLARLRALPPALGAARRPAARRRRGGRPGARGRRGGWTRSAR